MNFDSCYNNYDDFGEDGEKYEEFANIPKFIFGPAIIPGFSKSNKSSDNSTLLTTIFNGEYGIYLINGTNTEYTSRYLLECTKMQDYKGESYGDLMDVYQYLDKSHFINFLISKKFNKSIWAYEGISMSIQIVNSPNEKYSKIVILIESSDVPDYITNGLLDDVYTESNTTMNTSIPNIPLTVSTMKSKSYYKPIITYDITFGFNRNSKIDFSNISLDNFYNKIMIDYINDAIKTFHFPISSINLEKYSEKLLRVQYIIEECERLMNVKMICTPALYISDDNTDIRKYIYVNESTHLYGCEQLSDDDIPEDNSLRKVLFSNNMSSSDVSQIVNVSAQECGIISEFCEEYTMTACDNIIFTLNRVITSIEKLKSLPKPPKVFINNMVYPSKVDCILNYWKPSSPVVVDSMCIFGFINLDKEKSYMINNFYDLYEIIKSEIFEIFELSNNDYVSKKFMPIRCYESYDTSRIMLYGFVNSSKSIDEKSTTKKSRLWRGKK